MRLRESVPIGLVLVGIGSLLTSSPVRAADPAMPATVAPGAFEVGGGGRYDTLLGRFGRPLPAVRRISPSGLKTTAPDDVLLPVGAVIADTQAEPYVWLVDEESMKGEKVGTWEGTITRS